MSEITYPRTVEVAGKTFEEHFLRCPNCNDPMILRPGKFGPGVFYGCSNFPGCKSAHGCHPDGRPLGTPADQATKDWRIRAHEVFDRLWKDESDPRSARLTAYRWMQEEMGLSKDAAHIGKFSAQDCQLLIELVTDRLAGG